MMVSVMSQKYRTMGQRIQSARLDAGFETAEAFAEQLPVKVSTVRNWEQGRSRPRHDVLAVIAEVTGKHVGYFYGEASEQMDLESQIVRLRETLVQRRERLQAELAADRPPDLHPEAAAVIAEIAERGLEAVLQRMDNCEERELLMGLYDHVELHRGRLVVHHRMAVLPQTILLPAYYCPARGIGEFQFPE